MTLATDRAPAISAAHPAGTLDPTAGQVVPAPYFRRKAAAGQVLAMLLLVPGIPIIGLLVLAVRLTSRGPGIYSQTRVGRNGRTFRMYKIRTMRHDAESRSGPEWTKKDDRRVTWLGRWLRKLHLDEFPQLFNVVKGEMSLIGPRPERPEFTQILAQQVPGYLDRLLVNPGITGLAQINLPPDTSIDDVRRKLVLDLEYVRNASLLLDARMFISTLLRMMCLPGDLAMKLMRLQRNVAPLSQAEVSYDGPLTPSTIVVAHAPSPVNENGQPGLAPHVKGKPALNGVHKNGAVKSGAVRNIQVEVNGADV